MVISIPKANEIQQIQVQTLQTIPLVPPHLQTQRTHSESHESIYWKTPSYCSRHHLKISASVKRRSRDQYRKGCFNLKHLLSTPHDSKAAKPTRSPPRVARRTRTPRKLSGRVAVVSSETGSGKTGKTLMKSRLHPSTA